MLRLFYISNRNSLLTFILINALIMSLISHFIDGNITTWYSWIYRELALFIQFTTLSLLLALLLTLTTHFFLRKLRPIIFVIVFSMAQLLIIANLQVYSLYHFHLNGMVVNLFFSGALRENLAFSWSMWASISGIFIAVLLLEISILYISSRLSLFQSLYQKKWAWIFASIVVFFVLLNGMADAMGWRQITNVNRYIPWLPTITMRRQLARMGFDVIASKKSNNKYSGLNYPLNSLNCHRQQPHNLLLIIVDSLRFDMLDKDIMPHTYKLKTRGINFKDHYSNGNSTRYGMFSLFYGLPGNYWKAFLGEEKGSLLFDLTQKYNYQHFIYGASTLTFPEFDRTIFSDIRQELKKGSNKNSADNDREITNNLLNDIRNKDKNRPFFGMLFYDSPHAFHLPQNYPELFSPRLKEVNYLMLNKNYDPTAFLNLYRSTAHFVDTQIDRIITNMEQENLLDNSVVIITSDHGQEFNESKKNYWGHNSNFSQWQTKVPLLILWPNKPTQEIMQRTSHIDIIPSLLKDHFQCTNPTQDFSTGRSLFDVNDESRSIEMETWTESAILDGSNLYLISPLGDIDVVDVNYQSLDNQKMPSHILQNKLDNAARFLKQE